LLVLKTTKDAPQSTTVHTPEAQTEARALTGQPRRTTHATRCVSMQINGGELDRSAGIRPPPAGATRSTVDHGKRGRARPRRGEARGVGFRAENAAEEAWRCRSP
jgi:hypothetical protein